MRPSTRTGRLATIILSAPRVAIVTSASEGVIATVFLDWGFSFGAGLLFGLAGRSQIAAAPPGFSTRAFRWGFLYLQAGVLAIALAVYVRDPDWMWMFWVDPAALPVVVVVLAFAMYEAAFVAGFVVGPAVERARRGAGLVVVLATGACIVSGQIAARGRLVRLEAPEALVTIVGGTASLVALAALLRRIARAPAR